MNSNDIKLIAHDTLNEDEIIIIEVDYNGENKIIEIDKN